MKEKLMVFWDALPAKQRRLVALGSIGVVVLLFSFGGYAVSNRTPVKKDGGRKTVSLEPDLLKQNQYMESQKEISKRDEKLQELSKQLEELQKTGKLPAGTVLPNGQTVGLDGKLPALPGQPMPAAQGNAPALPGPLAAAGHPPVTNSQQGNKRSQGGAAVMPPPIPAGALPPPLPPAGLPQQNGPGGMQMASANGGAGFYSEQEMGDIAIVSGKSGPADDSASKKKESHERGVYLPPSFMAATLLSGLDAPTTEGAKGNPVPVIIRIQAPAILPNDVRANLRGCFIIADGRGNLGTERAELTLVSMSCLDRKGNALVDQKIKGFVVDQDGKIGLRGKVVAKFGATIARSMMAGFFGGVGDVVKQNSTTTAISPLGTTSNINPNDVLMAGVGSGLSAGFKDIQKFYMELARASMPVVEVGATKPLTVVISEGSEIKIRKLKGGRL